PENAGQDLVLDHADVPAIDIEALQARIEIDPQPFSVEDRIRIDLIKLLQPGAKRTRSIREQLLPADFKGLEIDLAVDLLDEIVLARKVAVEQRLGYAELARQGACAAGESFLREELGRLGDKFAAPIVG